MVQGKVHHKLDILTDYLKRDVKFANQKESNPEQITELILAQIGVAIGNVKKAQKMYRLVTSFERFCRDSAKKYSLKVAVFVSRHKVLSGADYLKLSTAAGDLDRNYDSARQQMPKYVRHAWNPFRF